jgi:hypothetical protein
MSWMITTEAKRHPAYVYGTSKGACLVHRVTGLHLHWVLDRKGMRKFSHHSISCACGQTFLQRRSQMCEIPNIDAIDCGRCWKNGPVFKWHSDYDLRKEAHMKLGCVVSAQ